MNTQRFWSLFPPMKKYISGLFFGLALALCGSAMAQTLAQAPLLTLKTAPGLVMLTLGRDLPLYTAAYNDLVDLDGDGVVDRYFKPTFRYEGYFAYDRCYDYGSSVFTPNVIGTKVTPNVNDKSKDYYKCSTATISTYWSGNFLNWLTMSRMDVFRKVLYGGLRSTDTTAATVLERSYIPQDSTIWAKQYTNVATDGYDIREYAPLDLPASTLQKHLFANVTLLAGQNANYTTTPNPPQFNVYKNATIDVVGLISVERTILITGPAPAVSNSYVVRVKTCVLLSSTYEDWCSSYPRNATSGTIYYKPTGLLHKYGEASTNLAFGLLTGTYDNNYSGGVVRQNVDDFSQEVNAANGTFSTVKGLVYNLSHLRPWGFGDSASSASWDCGFHWGSPRRNGECPMWGNPLGEMMYEALNYFAGGTPTTAYTTGVGTDRATATAPFYGPEPAAAAKGATDNMSGQIGTILSPEPANKLDLQRPAWINPFGTSASRNHTSAYPICSRPIQMVIGDPKTSFDGDQLPGGFPLVAGYGPAFSGTVGTLNVGTEADQIWKTEFGAGTSKTFFIGEAPGNVDGNPTAKTVSTFKNMRGHGPDATSNQGTFYGAAVARYGKFTGFANPAVASSTTTPLRLDQISIALDSPVPNIAITLGGKTISLVPVQKTIGGCSYGALQYQKGGYQATDAIVGFFVDKIANVPTLNSDLLTNGGRPYYKFRVTYADMDYGADNEQDNIVYYELQVTAANTLTVGVNITGSSTCAVMHAGYVISGTTADGMYLDVGTAGGGTTNLGYYLDTMPGKKPGDAMLPGAPPAGGGGTGPLYINITTRLSKNTTAAPRAFNAGLTASGEYVPHDMLWYAAKYGGASMDTSGGFNFKYGTNGTDPDSYFFANNPSKLSSQLGQAFQKAAALSAATSSAVSGNGVKVGGGSYVYQASYDTIKWGGDLNAFAVDVNGNVANTPTWRATTSQPSPPSRTIVLGRSYKADVPYVASLLVTPSSYSSLTNGNEQTNFKDSVTFQYLLGTRTSEQSNAGGTLRNRTSAIGDIVNSDPLYINSADFGYTDTAYQTFKSTSSPLLVGFGSNDGLYRLISATNGVEQLAYMPFGVQSQVKNLADPAYSHQYYVDGPANFGHVLFPGSGAGTGWRSILATSLGAGGTSVFAIDVTSSTFSASSVLWEYGNDPDLGNVVNKSIIGMLEDGTTPVVIVGNGLASTNGNAALLVLNAKTGALIRTCKPINAANTASNGLGATAFVSVNGNGKISYVYGADYKGNIWRFDPNLTGSGCSTNAELIFTAKDPSNVVQPITGELTIIAAPSTKTGYMVTFGTGSYLTATDPATLQVQSLYGIWDDLGTGGVTRSVLAQQSVVVPSTLAGTRKTTVVGASNTAWYDRSGFKGWYLDLKCTDLSICPAGERLVSKPTVQPTAAGTRLWFLSLVPGTDPCQVGGGGWLTSLDPTTGGYIKGFETMDQNSTYIEGVTPRGLFLVKRDATTNNPTTDILFVSITITGGRIPSPPGTVSSGGNNVGSDGSGTGTIGFGVSPKIDVGNAARRQVWRQIQ